MQQAELTAAGKEPLEESPIVSVTKMIHDKISVKVLFRAKDFAAVRSFHAVEFIRIFELGREGKAWSLLDGSGANFLKCMFLPGERLCRFQAARTAAKISGASLLFRLLL